MCAAKCGLVDARGIFIIQRTAWNVVALEIKLVVSQLT